MLPRFFCSFLRIDLFVPVDSREFGAPMQTTTRLSLLADVSADCAHAESHIWIGQRVRDVVWMLRIFHDLLCDLRVCDGGSD